ncbi:response regulator transcription factor [Paenibacillus turpanensis]|uniref:response regulator transcription factor n=1 Tax=Paenibacillus turpanensis TaxID=2689078 RepID=UPI00140CE371|nr:response regulator [Paenibacillus turpanensis]
MYKVLLVDDERIILEGIASVVEWGRCGTRLIGKAIDGRQALEMIEAEPPNIVITDIKMPEMNGIQLIEQVKERFPEIVFIILSGHEEFSSAQSAMKLGVRHYLLKPCNEKKIMQVLAEVVEELKEFERRGAFIMNNRENFAKVLPQIKEQFLKECITNKTYGKRDWEYYCDLLGLNLLDRPLRLILLEIEGKHDFEHLFALNNIAKEIVEQSGYSVYLNTSIGGRLALLVEEVTLESWTGVMMDIKNIYFKYYKLDVTVAVSSPDSLPQLRRLYKETLECLSHRFYLGEGSVITSGDIDRASGGEEDIAIDADALAFAIRSGNAEQVRELIKEAFCKLKGSKLSVDVVKSYVLELYLNVMRQAGPRQKEGYSRGLMLVESLSTLELAEEYVREAAAEAAGMYYESNMQTQSRTIRRVIQYVHEHLSDESLSLSRLAQEVFHLNVDYLGKLFRKETGEKFSNYLMNIRMEEAKKLIEKAESLKILEVAAKVGFGSNPPYFSQVFKRYTGCTPSEYKKSSVI